MPILLKPVDCTLTPHAFMGEVACFERALVDPALTLDDKARHYARIVRQASRLDPHDPGFERAGVALKEALCAWLCCREAA